MKLSGKVAIVTGSSRGLGKAIAMGLAREGADVVIAARTETEGKLPGTIYKTAEEIQALGYRAIPVKCDVTNEQSVSDMVHKALTEFGHIDILVNNAGVAYPYSIAETPLKRWELVLRVNLTGAFLCTRAVIPEMIKQRRGSIINISSLAANLREGEPVFTGLAYGIAKAGLDRFTWGLAAELRQHNIAVNAIKPTRVVDTEGMRFVAVDVDKTNWVSPKKMVKCAIFLATQDANGITGLVTTDEELSQRYSLA